MKAERADRVLLGNIDYVHHTSTEGHEFQLGLQHAGWHVCGKGFDGRQDVGDILRDLKPSMVVVHDRRDWAPDNPGCFRKDVGYTDLGALRDRRDIYKACIVKDAGSISYYHRMFCEEVGADAAIIYYSPRIVARLNPWMAHLKLRMIRVYHSIDRDFCETIDLHAPRRRCVVTGATSRVYPVRQRVMRRALATGQKDMHVVGHPGYHNRGSHTPGYLQMLSGYRVHVATASVFGFALRKIIESVTMGCTPVTNLPAHDILPEIDEALVRISSDASLGEVEAAVTRADRTWDLEERLAYAHKAQKFYDWREAGIRLDTAIRDAKHWRDALRTEPLNAPLVVPAKNVERV